MYTVHSHTVEKKLRSKIFDQSWLTIRKVVNVNAHFKLFVSFFFYFLQIFNNISSFDGILMLLAGFVGNFVQWMSGINVFGDSKKKVLLSHRIYLSLILCTLHRLSPPFPFNTHHPDILLWWHPKSVTPLVHIFKTPVNFPYQYRIKWHFVNTYGIDYGLLIDIASSYFIHSNHWKK